MTLDATKPADTNLVSEMGTYERETRAAVNALEALLADVGAVASMTRYTCTGGQTTIAVGGSTGLTEIPIELVLIGGTGAAAIEEITGGTEGQIKIFVMLNAYVHFVKDTTKIALNQPDSAPNYGGYTGDILALANVNGNGSTVDGYWTELFRTPRSY